MKIPPGRLVAVGLLYLAITLAVIGVPDPAYAEERIFTRGGTNVTLVDVTSSTEVYFLSMRLNRAVNQWNVELQIRNTAVTVLSSPTFVVFESVTNATGPIGVDGIDSTGKSWLDFSSQLPSAGLLTGEFSSRRTIALGVTTGTPQVSVRVFASAPALGGGVALANIADALGHPLPGAQVTEVGPTGSGIVNADPNSGSATLGRGAGTNTFLFTAPGYLPVWRRALLSEGTVSVLPTPRLTQRETNSVPLSSAAGTVSNRLGLIRITIPSNAFAAPGEAILTPLTAQTLPAPLPQGWSPLQVFWLELSSEPAVPLPTRLSLSDSVKLDESAALVRWNSNSLEWVVNQLNPGNGSAVIDTVLPGSGAFALVVPDRGGTAPPNPVVSQPLPAAMTASVDYQALSGRGLVSPATRPASQVADLVTAQAALTISNASGVLPSGSLFRGEVSERYEMQDGSVRVLPKQQVYITGYQRPGTGAAKTVEASFPIRPQLLLGADELLLGSVEIDVLPPTEFIGGVVDTNGTTLSNGAVQLTIPAGAVTRVQAAQLDILDTAPFGSLLKEGFSPVAAFQLRAGGLTDRQLTLQISGLQSNASFVLARLRTEGTGYGLEPVERLTTDAQGKLVSAEPASSPRLPGITSAGQFVLVQVAATPSLVTGTARDSAGQNVPGLLIEREPWLTFSMAGGTFQILSSAGAARLRVIDLATRDLGFADVTVPAAGTLTGVELAVANEGPRVLAVSPTDGATNVSILSAVVVTFSKSINPVALATGELKLLGTSNVAVNASVTLNLANTTATFLSSEPLQQNTLYTITLSTNIVDAAGRHLAGANVFTFRTAFQAFDRGGSQLTSYEPINGSAGLVGGPGTAEPDAPVILVNETTGRTSTIRSKPDGSFSNSIPAEVDDRLSAVLVNQNGTRNTVRVSRQKFADGSEALFEQGGTIEVAGENGPIQFIIEPGAIPGKTKFKFEAVPLTVATQTLHGVQPTDGGLVLGGVKMSPIKGSPLTQAIDVRFPVKLSDMQLPDGVNPTNCGFGLAIARVVDGETVFELIDRMLYEDGQLVTHSPPFFGLLGPYEELFLLPFLMVVNQTPKIVNGKVYANEVGATNAAGTNFLYGAIVTGKANTDGAIRGRLRSGAVYTVSRERGEYTLLLNLTAGSPGFVGSVSASHPLFPHTRAELAMPELNSSQWLTIGNVYTRADLVFPIPPGGFSFPPGLSASHTPLYPATNTGCLLKLTATDNNSAPTLVVEVQSVFALNPGDFASPQDVVIVPQPETVTATSRQQSFQITTYRALQCVLKLTATDSQGNAVSQLYSIAFGADVPSPASNPPAADTNDHTGPLIISMTPPPDSTGLAPGQPIVLRLNEPVRKESLTMPSVFVLSPPVGTPEIHLSEDQREIRLTYPGITPGTLYSFVAGTTIQDLNDNFLDQDSIAPGNQPFSANFRSAPERAFGFPVQPSDRGVVGSFLQGNYAYVLDRSAASAAAATAAAQPLGTELGRLAVYELTNPAQPTLVGQYLMPPYPRDLLRMQNYSFFFYGTNDDSGQLVKASQSYTPMNGAGGTPIPLPRAPRITEITNRFTNDLIAVVGGLAGNGENQWLRILDISDPIQPRRLAGTLVSQGNFIPSRLRWSPPVLAYLESGDRDRISLVNLQSLLFMELLSQDRSAYLELPEDGSDGVDLNQDGDYTDDGEQPALPASRPVEFGGKIGSITIQDTSQPIRDFVLENGGNFIGAIVGPGNRLDAGGQPVSPAQPVPAGYRTLFKSGLSLTVDDSQFSISNGSPRRLLALMGYPLSTPSGTALRDLMCITVNREDTDTLLVLDVTDPLTVTEVISLPLPASPTGDNINSIVKREDGLLAVAGDGATFLIDPALFQKPFRVDGTHPAILGTIKGVGGFPRNFASTTYGYHFNADDASRGRLVQTPPTFAFVQFPTNTPFGYSMLTNLLWFAPTNLTRISTSSVTATIPSNLWSLVPTVEHFPATNLSQTVWTNLNVTQRAQSLASAEIVDFLAPSFLRNVGKCDSSSRLAWRDYYVMINAPGGAGPTIELALESLDWAGQPMRKRGLLFPPVHALSASALNTIGQTPDADDAPVRSLKAWRLSDDPNSDDFNRYLSRPFWLITEAVEATELSSLHQRLDREILWSGQSLRVGIDPVMTTNAVLGPFAAQADIFENVIKAGATAIAESFPADMIPSPNPGPINGELLLPTLLYAVSAANSELVMKNTDLVLPGRRMPISFQRTFRGQAIYDGPFGRGWDFNFNQRVVEVAGCITVTARENPDEQEGASTGDLLFYPGGAAPIVFRFVGSNAPPEIVADPLIQYLGWLPRAARFYLPPEGMFSPMLKFKDGRYVRLDPDGKQTWFNAAGRLEKIYDRYEKNAQELVYNSRGQLIRIYDDVRRPLDLGYYRNASDPLFRSGYDMAPTQPTDIGRVCRLRDYSGRDVFYTYTSDGLLDRFQGVDIATGPATTFRGRQEIKYRYTGSTNVAQTAKSLNGVEAGDVGGAPLISVMGRSGQGRDVISSVSVMGQVTDISQNFKNVASELEKSGSVSSLARNAAPAAPGGATNRVQSPDGSWSTVGLDTVGRPTESIYGGLLGASVTNRQEYFGSGANRGLVRATVSSSGDRTEYLYDISNPVLRSRGNMLSLKKIPGPRGGPVLESTVNYDSWYNLPSGDKTDFNGVPATIILTTDHRAVERITRAGEQEKFEYNEFGQLKKHTGMDGVVSEITYTADGFVQTRKVGDLPPTTFSYDAVSGAQSQPGLRGRPSAVTDGNSITTYFIHDELDRIVAEQREGSITSQAFDRVGNLIERVTQVETNRVVVQQFIYSSHAFLREHRVLNVETDSGVTNLITQFEPDAMNRVARMITPSGEEHRYFYDHLGQLAVEEIPGRQTNFLTHDLSGNLVQVQKGDAIERFIYDGHERLIGTIGANQTATEYVLDNNGNMLTNRITDANGQLMYQSWATYDALNRQRTRVLLRDDGPVTASFDYFPSDRKMVVTDALNQTVESFSDLAGRVTRVVSPHKTVELDYDAGSRVIKQRFIEGGKSYEAMFGYNTRQQLTSVSNKLGYAQRFTVEVDGRVVRDTDRENHITTNVFTLLGELAARILPNGVTQTNTYDVSRNIASVADSSGNTSRYLFDAQNRGVTNYLPNGQFETYEDFNIFGSPRRQRIPRGITVTSGFDFEGKLTNRTVTGFGPTLHSTYYYDGMRRYSRIEDDSGVTVFRYDLGGYVRDLVRTNTFGSQPASVSPLPNTVSQQSDRAGFRTLLTYPDGALKVTMQREPAGRLTAVLPEVGEPVITNMVWEGDSRATSYVLGKGRVQLEFFYDDEPRMIGKRYTRLSDGKVLADLRYSFDRNGAVVARQQLHRGGVTDFFRYDSGKRLVRSDASARPGTGLFNGLPGFAPVGVSGNWRPGLYAREMSYSTDDRLTQVTTYNPLGNSLPLMGTNFAAPDAFVCSHTVDGFVRQVDEIGNVTRMLLAVRIAETSALELIGATLAYNASGQLERIDRDDGVTVRFEYDAFGLRLRKAVTGPASRCTPSDIAFIYNDGLLLEERDLSAGGGLLRRYYYGDTGDEPLAADVRATVADSFQRVYFLSDTLRSVVSVTDAAGAELERRNFDAWGQPVFELPDTSAPQLSAVRQETNGFLLVFSEPVLPSLTVSPNPTNGPVSIFPELFAGIQFTNTFGSIAGTFSYEDSLPLGGYGSVIRFVPTQPVTGAVSLNISAAFLQDEWANRNAAVAVNLTAGQPAGTVLFSGVAAGSTRSKFVGRSPSGTAFGFHGQYFDDETGLLYCRARYYDAYTGTFTQRDPSGYSDGVNQYAGFANNPVNFRDPTGTSVTSDMRQMGETLQEEAEAHLREGGVINDLKAKYESAMANLLMLPSAAIQSWEVLNSPSQGGSLDLLRRIEAAETLANAPGQVKAAVSKATGYYRNLRTVSGFLARRVEGFQQAVRQRVRAAQARREAHEYLVKQGLTSWEAEGLINFQAQLKAKYGVDSVEIAVRGFGPKANARRANREAGMATKPGWASDKTAEHNAISKVEINHGGKKVSRELTGDLDLYYVKVDGRTLSETEVAALKTPINQAIGAAYKRQGGTGIIGSSVHHGAHVNLPELYGTTVNNYSANMSKMFSRHYEGEVTHRWSKEMNPSKAKHWDDKKLASVSGPGAEAFAIRTDGAGRVQGFTPQKPMLIQELNEANHRFWLKTGRTLESIEGMDWKKDFAE